MKKILYAVLGCFLMGIVACSESFLDLAPPSYLSESTFYITEDHFDQALSGAYSSLRGLSARAGYLMGEMRSDNTHYTLYEADRGLHIQRREEIANFVDDNKNDWTNQFYYDCYSGIARVNTIEDRIAGASLSEEFKTKILSEARFVRSLFYFYLVRYYGPVPLYLHEVHTAQDSYVGNSTVEQLYAQIIADANFAADNLPMPSFSDKGTQQGRATKGSAKMLLAKVYMTMTQRDYAKAEQLLIEITKMGYDLLPKYSDIFELANKNSRESIFEIQYQMGEQGQQSDWIYYFAPKTTDGTVIFGNNASTMLTGGWNVPTKDLMDCYENGDTRFNASIAVAEGTGDINTFVPDAVKDARGYVPISGKTYYYFIRKYLHAHAKKENTDDNWPVFRYADALLMLSECLVEQGKSGDTYLMDVRNRAWGGQAPAIAASKETIAKERRLELAFENHRWLDLIRTGKAIEVMNAYGIKAKALYPYLSDKTYNVTANKLIFPIPYMELQLNSKLNQNSGY